MILIVLYAEVVTRLSPESCQRMADGKAVAVLFKLMRQCNRSLPHMELLKYALYILLNLSKVCQLFNNFHILCSDKQPSIKSVEF